MMKRFLASLFLVCIMVFSFTSVSYAENWEWIMTTDDTKYSFDTTSVKDNSIKNINPECSQFVYSVNIKYEYTNSKGQDMAKKHNFKKPISYIIYEEDINYKTKSELIKSMYLFDNDGKIILGGPTYCTEFQPITPASIGEAIYIATLKQYQAQYGKK